MRPPPPVSGDVLLEAKDVSQRFRLPTGQDFEALRNVTLTIHEGEVVALVGPSGCGKSTLLRLLCGLSRPGSGEVRYRGRPIEGVLPAAAMVFQSFALLPWSRWSRTWRWGSRRAASCAPATGRRWRGRSSSSAWWGSSRPTRASSPAA